MIHMYRPSNKLAGVVIIPSIVHREGIQDFLKGPHNTEYKKLLAVLLGGPEKFFRGEQLVASRYPNGVSLVHAKEILSIQPSSSSIPGLGNYYGKGNFWQVLREFAMGRGYGTTNNRVATKILETCNQYGKDFTLQIDIKPAMQAIKPLWMGLDEVVSWDEFSPEEV